MANMTMPRHEMPAQEPDVRNKNFSEVALGYTKEMAMEEATRCLGCPKMPCKNGCPVQINIPDFITKVAEGDFEAAYQIINKTSSLPAVCGRVCPQENQCEKYCVRGIKGEAVAIGRLERFVADWHNANATQPPKKPETNGHKVAIIGSGPAGLTCAGDLAKMGYEVTVFEALHKAGGVLVYGIPEFRLPKAIVQKEVDTLKELGVEKVYTGHCTGEPAFRILKSVLGSQIQYVRCGQLVPADTEEDFLEQSRPAAVSIPEMPSKPAVKKGKKTYMKMHRLFAWGTVVCFVMTMVTGYMKK